VHWDATPLRSVMWKVDTRESGVGGDGRPLLGSLISRLRSAFEWRRRRPVNTALDYR